LVIFTSYAFSDWTVLVGWLEGHVAVGGWCGAGVVICLERGADLLMPLSLDSVKFRLVLFLWYHLTGVVLATGPLDECCCYSLLCYPFSFTI